MKIIKTSTNLKNNLPKLLVLADQAIISGGNFLLGIVPIRLLGLKEYGLFAMLWMGVLFVLSLHQAFITKPIMTLAIGQSKEEQAHYFALLGKIQLVFGSILLSVLCGFNFIVNGTKWATAWIDYLPIIGCITFFYLLQDFYKKTFFIKKEYSKPLIMDGLSYGMIFIGLFGLSVLNQVSLKNALLIISIGYLTSIPFYGKDLFQKNNRTGGPSWFALIKKHYHFSSWLLGTSILQWFSGNFFLIAAASTLGTTAVGAVRIGQNIVGLCHILFLAMENIVPAEAAQLFLQKDFKKLWNYLMDITLKIGVIVIGVLSVMALLAPKLIEWIYGADFAQYSYVVWGYCLLYAFVFIGFPLRYFFRTIQFTQPIFMAYCLSTVFSIGLAFPIVRNWGIIGVLAGLMLSQLLTLLVYIFYIFSHKKQSVNFSNV